jgi:hypothetical protein
MDLVSWTVEFGLSKTSLAEAGWRLDMPPPEGGGNHAERMEREDFAH